MDLDLDLVLGLLVFGSVSSHYVENEKIHNMLETGGVVEDKVYAWVDFKGNLICIKGRRWKQKNGIGEHWQVCDT